MAHKDHIVKNETHYHVDTPEQVINAIEYVRQSRERVRIFLGDTKTGTTWLEEWDVSGRIGRSMGPCKVPLLIANRRSIGGGALLDHCIVGIKAKYRWVYKHPKFNVPEFRIKPDGEKVRVVNVKEGSTHARFKNTAQAQRWIAFMNGQRMSK